MATVTVDFEAVRKAVLAELQRQGIEFANVKVRDIHRNCEGQLVIEAFNQSEIRPEYVEQARVAHQLESK